ncbi:ParA family protein [Hamadaea sp. NPDC051192]|uniref:ParA family protein n=1 Tax=Hamadaea sp. NPDC051192 TaxID=3154940 RepID=UPI00342E6DC9
MPRVVSVINYKGGVGKTTLTANIGAELAQRGRRVLLVDLDPQASLTFCFYTATQWENEIEDARTVLQWIGPLLSGGEAEPLEGFTLTPARVNEVAAANGGRLDIVASHLGLIDADQDLAIELGGSRVQVRSPNFLRVHRVLADALARPAFDGYDVILLDCPPNFGMMTRAGIVASDGVLVPARPDYLSTLGISYLRGRLSELIDDYGRAAALTGSTIPDVAPEILGVVLNMVQYAGTQPINAHQSGIRGLDPLEIKVFDQRIRQSNSLFGGSENGLPVVLAPGGNATVQYELQQLTSEFYARIRT